MKDHLAKIGVDPELMTLAQFTEFFTDDYDDTLQLAKDANIKPVD